MSGAYVNHPEYASYNWTGAPANYALATDAADGGDSSNTPPLKQLQHNGSEAHHFFLQDART
jgi:hypothetical protein